MEEILVVSSKLKAYVKEAGELKCSAEVITAVSNKVKVILDEAILIAKADKRKTLKARDIK